MNYFEHSGAIRDAVGQLLVQAGKLPEAVAMFREASILSEDDNGIRERLAMALYQIKEYREAADLFSSAGANRAGLQACRPVHRAGRMPACPGQGPRGAIQLRVRVAAG